jgi:hypothetical protein
MVYKTHREERFAPKRDFSIISTKRTTKRREIPARQDLNTFYTQWTGAAHRLRA